MTNLVPYAGRIGMPSLLGWDPARLFDQLFEPFRREAAWDTVKVTDEEDHVLITADMPGVDPKDVEVTFEGGLLSVSGQRDEEREYRFTVDLGNTIDGDKIEAALDKGVLTIRAEKRPEIKPRKIALRSGEAQSLESGAAQ